MCIVVGESGSGKTSVIRQIAALAGRRLVSLPITAEMDTIELLGGFEQVYIQAKTNHHSNECTRTPITARPGLLELNG